MTRPSAEPIKHIYEGVSECLDGWYEAFIIINHKRIQLGRFRTPRTAALVRDAALRYRYKCDRVLGKLNIPYRETIRLNPRVRQQIARAVMMQQDLFDGE